jgi:hypothetical protein
VRAVYRVTQAIPEIGALPGDCIVAEPANPTHPIILTRRLDRGTLPLVLDDNRFSLQRLESRCDLPPSMRRQRPARDRSHLRLIG